MKCTDWLIMVYIFYRIETSSACSNSQTYTIPLIVWAIDGLWCFRLGHCWRQSLLAEGTCSTELRVSINGQQMISIETRGKSETYEEAIVDIFKSCMMFPQIVMYLHKMFQFPKMCFHQPIKRAFSNFSPRLWNSLPQHLKDTHDISRFQQSLKTHLFRISLCRYWVKFSFCSLTSAFECITD